MKLARAVVVACVLLCSRAASAHRIDEYLQATMVTLDQHQMQASMRLVPGVLVAPSVIAVIDSNHDGVFSSSEQQVYAERVLRDLSITLDGKDLSPRTAGVAPSPAGRAAGRPRRDPARIRRGSAARCVET